MTQFFAGVKKEILELLKTYRIIAFVGGFVFISILNPILIWLLPKFAQSLEIEGVALFVFTQEHALASFLSECFQTGLLVMLISMTRAAGGDQKNKTCILPITLGFKKETYIYSKFAVYPVFAFFITLITFFIAYAVSYPLFAIKVNLFDIAPNLIAICVLISFSAILVLAMGCITGRGGISAASVILLFMFLEPILNVLQINHYNPLALARIAREVVNYHTIEQQIELVASVGITFAISALLIILTTKIFKNKHITS